MPKYTFNPLSGKFDILASVKADVGLGNVDNTSDANKPVSTAQQTALDLKLDISTAATTYVPYTGATGIVNLSGVSLISNNNAIHNNGSFDFFSDVGVTQTLSLFALTNQLAVNNPASGFSALLDVSGMTTVDRTFSFPDTSGTIALTSYVDSVAQGLSIKESVQVATATALPTNIYNNGASGVGATLTAVATGVLTVDGVNVALNDRVLVKDEVATANNGIYKCTLAGAIGVAYILTRSTNFDQTADVPGAFTFVENGTVNDGAGFVVADAGPYTMGTTAITFTQFSGAGQITAGAGLTKTGNTLDAVGTANRIVVNADSIDIGSNVATGGGTASGTNTGDQVISDATITTTDITTNNFTIAKHGFTPKGTNVGNFLKDDGTWGTPTAVAADTNPNLYVTTADYNLLANYGVYYPSEYEIGSGFVTDLAVAGILEIG